MKKISKKNDIAKMSTREFYNMYWRKPVHKLMDKIILDKTVFSMLWPYLQHYSVGVQLTFIEEIAIMALLPIERREDLRQVYGNEFMFMAMYAAIVEMFIINKTKYNNE